MPVDGYTTLNMATLMEEFLQVSLLKNWALLGYVPAAAWEKRPSLKSSELSVQVAADIKKRPPDFHLKVSEGWRLPTLPLGIAVPSALTGLTSLFGMGRGGSPSLLPPLFYRLMLAHCVFSAVFSHSIWCKREKKFQSILLSCNSPSQRSHTPQLKCRAISTARL